MFRRALLALSQLDRVLEGACPPLPWCAGWTWRCLTSVISPGPGPHHAYELPLRVAVELHPPYPVHQAPPGRAGPGVAARRYRAPVPPGRGVDDAEDLGVFTGAVGRRRPGDLPGVWKGERGGERLSGPGGEAAVRALRGLRAEVMKDLSFYAVFFLKKPGV